MPIDCSIQKWCKAFIWYSECMNDDDFHEFETDKIQCWWRIGNFTHMVHDYDFVRGRGWSNCIVAWFHWRQNKVRIFYNYAFYIQHYLLFVCVNSPVLFYRVSFPIQEFIPLCMLLLKLIVVDKILLKQTWLSKWLLNFDRMKCSGAAKLASEVQELLSNYY